MDKSMTVGTVWTEEQLRSAGYRFENAISNLPDTTAIEWVESVAPQVLNNWPTDTEVIVRVVGSDITGILKYGQGKLTYDQIHIIRN
jgi:hypothetical protein